jgi:hypothetical protein
VAVKVAVDTNSRHWITKPTWFQYLTRKTAKTDGLNRAWFKPAVVARWRADLGAQLYSVQPNVVDCVHDEQFPLRFRRDYASKPSTSSKAPRTSGQRLSGRAAIHGPRYTRSTIRIHSGLTTHGLGTPSASVKATSHERPRACVERGITGTWLSDGRMSGRPSTRTGRRLSGAPNRNHLMSPRAITGTRGRRRQRSARPARP